MLFWICWNEWIALVGTHFYGLQPIARAGPNGESRGGDDFWQSLDGTGRVGKLQVRVRAHHQADGRIQLALQRRYRMKRIAWGRSGLNE